MWVGAISDRPASAGDNVGECPAVSPRASTSPAYLVCVWSEPPHPRTMKTKVEFGKLASPLIYKVKIESDPTKLKLSEIVKNIYTKIIIFFLEF